MSSYTDVLMKKDMYKEYKQSVDRYLPIEQIQKEMEKNTLKYVLHQYLRVRNLCDQGIDDPDDVAEILGIPPYMAEDLVYEYYLIPKEFDRRHFSLPADDPRLKLLVGLPYLVEPRKLLAEYTDISAIETALYVGIYSLLWFGASRSNPFIFRPPTRPFITDDFCFPEYFRLKSANEPTLIDSGPSGLDSAFNMLPSARKSVWILDFKNELKNRIETELNIDNQRNKLKFNPSGINKDIWRQYPGNQKPVANLYV